MMGKGTDKLQILPPQLPNFEEEEVITLLDLYWAKNLAKQLTLNIRFERKILMI